MRFRIHPHAFDHGLTEDQISWAFQMAAMEERIRERDRDTEPPRWGVIGLDSAGRPIQLVAVALSGGEALIIQAQYLTAGFLKEMREAR